MASSQPPRPEPKPPPPKDSDDLLLTEAQAAKRLNVSRKTLFNMRKGIPFVDCGGIRYSPDDIRKWIEANKVSAVTSN